MLVNWGVWVWGSSEDLNILLPVLEHGSRLLFMSSVGVVHTSCVHGTGGLLPSLRGGAANLMLTELGDVRENLSRLLLKQ